MYEQGVDFGFCSKTDDSTKQDNGEAFSTGFISIAIMNEYKNEGYKFVQKVDDEAKIFEDNTEWDEDKITGKKTKTFHTILNNNTHSQWVRMTSDGYWYYKNGEVVTTTGSTSTAVTEQGTDSVYDYQNQSIIALKDRLLASTKSHYTYDRCSDSSQYRCTRVGILKGVWVFSFETSGCLGTRTCHKCIDHCVGRIGYRYYKALGYNCGGPCSSLEN
jgi:hypothetical protein